MGAHSRSRTEFAVRDGGATRVEIIHGERAPWDFRPHFHAADERVEITAGRARLRIGDVSRLVEAGEILVVPAGAVHRFEPVDREGWGFASEFVSPADPAGLLAAPVVNRNGGFGMLVRAALAERLSLQTDVRAIAEALDVSVGYLSRAFKRDTGTSLHNFHVLMALQKAKYLMRAHEPVAHAAIDAGFCDQAHLTREFVRTLGMTPGTFRSAWTTVA
jgi:AraC-like DNA-binding protein/quercetin dioxygenase-like cupin family protein